MSSEASPAHAVASFAVLSDLTVGDIALGNAIHRWFMLKIKRPELPTLGAWYERLRARPAYRKHVMGE